MSVAAAFTADAALLTAAATTAVALLGRLDNRLGDDMILNPHSDLAGQVRRWLGLDRIHQQLTRNEENMATVIEALTALAAQVNAVSAAQATSFHNLQAAIDKLKSGELTADQQDAVDQIEKSLTTLADDAQKADDGFEPTEPPADGGDTPADNGGDTPPVAKTKR